jgi:hypothetical protein
MRIEFAFGIVDLVAGIRPPAIVVLPAGSLPIRRSIKAAQ